MSEAEHGEAGHAGNLLKAIAESLGGRGGGNAQMAQGQIELARAKEAELVKWFQDRSQ